jgi:hypothetical protein
MAFYGKRGVDMTINGKPDKNTERTEPAEDEGIIELKDEIEGGPEDDVEILDLLDAVEELSIEDQKDVVLTETEESVEDDEILELTNEIIEPSQDDDEIIDLIEEPGASIFKTDAPSLETDDITDLEIDLFEETIDFDEELDQEVPLDPSLKDDFVDSLGIELETGEDIPEGSLKAERVSDEQIEAALERVIKKMFYEKIDGILVEVIEKTVKTEIERLKNILLEEESGIEK